MMISAWWLIPAFLFGAFLVYRYFVWEDPMEKMWDAYIEEATKADS